MFYLLLAWQQTNKKQLKHDWVLKVYSLECHENLACISVLTCRWEQSVGSMQYWLPVVVLPCQHICQSKSNRYGLHSFSAFQHLHDIPKRFTMASQSPTHSHINRWLLPCKAASLIRSNLGLSVQGDSNRLGWCGIWTANIVVIGQPALPPTVARIY